MAPSSSVSPHSGAAHSLPEAAPLFGALEQEYLARVTEEVHEYLSRHTEHLSKLACRHSGRPPTRGPQVGSADFSRLWLQSREDVQPRSTFLRSFSAELNMRLKSTTTGCEQEDVATPEAPEVAQTRRLERVITLGYRGLPQPPHRGRSREPA